MRYLKAEQKVAIKAKEREYAEWEENILDRLTRMDRSAKAFARTKREMDEGAIVFMEDIVALKYDMKIMETTVRGVGKLAKFGFGGDK